MSNSTIRIEYLPGNRDPLQYQPQTLRDVKTAVVMSIDATVSTTAAVVPKMAGTGWGEARIVVAGAPVIMTRDGTNPSQTVGVRLDVGVNFVQVKTGDTLAFIQDAGLVSTVTNAGSVGKDYSSAKPTLPVVGANFAASGPYASYVLLATVPANPARSLVEIQNTSGGQIVIVRDDGTAANAAAPVNASVMAMNGGSGVGSQGSGWDSQTFKGRIQVYGPSAGLQVGIWED